MTEKERRQAMLDLMVPRMHSFYKGLREKGEVPTNAEILAACPLPREYRSMNELQNLALVEVRDDVDIELRHVKSGGSAPAKDDEAGAKASGSMVDRQAALQRAKHVRREAVLAVIKSESAARRERARADMVAAARASNAAKGRTANGIRYC
ncbi:hypothetical protein [Ensifer sp. ZNC0028]|uniref:hypothetical protein n=1 Tax=Ensifer sp. ZNC0028 TaxID=1339236 RepID=UPI0005B834DA|nr:hypothetical protein [Ensifer sp. ZNC0028]